MAQLDKKVKDICARFNNVPENVYFAILVSSGINRLTAAQLIFRPQTAVTAVWINNHIFKPYPNTHEIITLFENERLTAETARKARAYDKAVKEGKIKESGLKTGDFRSPTTDKNGIIKTPGQTGITEGKEGRNKLVNELTTKSGVLSHLISVVPELSGKERVDALMKIADLQRMKQDENKQDEKRVHFYLPLSCDRCKLRQNKEKS